MPSNASRPDVSILPRSLAVVIHGHVSLQGPLLIELSGFWLMAASSMNAQVGARKTIDKQQEERWRSNANRNASNGSLLSQRNVDVTLISEAGIENEGGQQVAVFHFRSRADS